MSSCAILHDLSAPFDRDELKNVFQIALVSLFQSLPRRGATCIHTRVHLYCNRLGQVCVVYCARVGCWGASISTQEHRGKREIVFFLCFAFTCIFVLLCVFHPSYYSYYSRFVPLLVESLRQLTQRCVSSNSKS